VIETGALLDRAKKYERQGRSEEAAAAYAGVADAFEAQGDWPSAVAVRARHARALAAAGRANEALQVLARADQAAGSLPREAADARAVLDGQAAYVMEGAGRTADAARRAWAAMVGFRQLRDDGRADRAAVHAAKLIVKDASPSDALQPLHELMTHLPPGGEAHRQVAAILAEVQRRPDRDYDILVTDPDSAAWGRLAAALAVGAHLAVGNGAAWNSLTHDEDPDDNRTLLERDWGVTDHESWKKQMDALLAAENSDPAIQVVLDRRGRGTPDHHAWQVAIADWCREKDISTKTINALLDLSGEILKYEARFRADGLLAPDGRVESVYGYDFGRAVNMARWGLNAGFCEREDAEDCVLRAGHYAHQVYTSWGDFSAGYILGRMLRFDDGEFGEWYDRSLAGHRILIDDPASPWRRMAWG
jgi:hypothetical protein